MTKINLTVAILMGGRSAEREVSLVTGQEIEKALKQKGYKTVPLELDQNVAENLKASKCDVVFIALHGSPGEDGTIQGMLEILGLPYVGSGVLASALGMDKVRSKMFFTSLGIPAPFHMVVTKAEKEKQPHQLLDRLLSSLGLPMVIKPSDAGSALGVKIVKTKEEIAPALEAALNLSSEAVVEEYIKGTEITVGVLGTKSPRTLPAIEIISQNEFYDYEAKYTPGLSQHIIPPRVSKEALEKAEKFALAAHLGLGCRCFSRVDFIVEKEDELPYILEINTIPGMTPVSLFPDAAKAAGIDFPDLVELLIKLALEDRKTLKPLSLGSQEETNQKEKSVGR